MRHVRLIALATLLLLVGAGGCGSRPAVQVALSAADFAGAPQQARTVHLTQGADLAVSLGADSLAFAWQASPAGGVLQETAHRYDFPKGSDPAAPITQRWTYRALTPGTATLTYDYSACGAMCAPYPPADPNEGAARSLTLEVVVE